MLWDENTINIAVNQITWSHVSPPHLTNSFILHQGYKFCCSRMGIMSFLCPSFGDLGSTEVRSKLQQVSCTVGTGDTWAFWGTHRWRTHRWRAWITTGTVSAFPSILRVAWVCYLSSPEIVGMLDQNQGVQLLKPCPQLCSGVTVWPLANLGLQWVLQLTWADFHGGFLPHCSGELVERVSLASHGFSKQGKETCNYFPESSHMTCPSTVLGAGQVRWNQRLAFIPLTLLWIWIPLLA